MTICKTIKERQATPICVYKMMEIHYSSGKPCKYFIGKYINGRKDRQIVMPVSRQIADAVWEELELRLNDRNY